MRPAISNAWWSVLGSAGLTRDRWRGLPVVARRGIKVAVWLGILLILIAAFGVWKTTALAVAAVATLVVMMIFTMMALGLNFVVGYAGLLDLGYVAFYAMGAYSAGWFASNQFANQKLNVGAVGL